MTIRERIVSGKRRTERVYALACVRCARVRFLKRWDYDKAIRSDSPCRRCQQSAAGKLGFAAAMLGGLRARRKAWQARQTYRLNHPSDLELTTCATLKSLGIPFTREVLFESTAGNFWLVDFIIPGGFAIEVQGEYWHSTPRQRRVDGYKKGFLTRRNYDLLRLEESVIRGGTAKLVIAEFLGVSPYEQLRSVA